MNIMKKALFIDRDGTLIKEPADEQIDAFEKLAFVPGVMRNLAFIRQKLDYEFVMVSNQDGLGTEAFPEDTFWPVHNLMMRTLEGEGVTFDDVLIDRSFPEENLPTRKPGTAMLGRYTSGDYDMEACWVIGDRETDAQLALNLGCRALILKEKDEDSFTDERIRYVNSWDRIAEILFAGERKVRVRRTTKDRSVIIGCPIQQSIVGVHFQRLNVVVEVAIVRHPFGAGDVIQRKGKHHARLIGKAIAVGYRVEVAFPVTGQSIHHNANVTANGAQAFCTAAELINPHQLVAIVDTIKLLVLGIVSQVCTFSSCVYG